MKKMYLFIFIIFASLLFTSCEDYVTGVEPFVDVVNGSELNSETQLPFLYKGVETRFAWATSRLNNMADGLSDEFFFDQNVPNATYPTFREIDKGVIYFDNNSIGGGYRGVGQYRFYADDLIRRTNSITITDEEVKNKALFTGYFYGGYARYQYATYFGVKFTEGGGTIDAGPFIKSSDMYKLALDKFKESLKYTTDAAQIRIVNSVIARTYLYMDDFANAATFAAQGMKNGDAPFQALHSVSQRGDYWAQSGNGRTQFVVDFRFKDYIDADPNEANRIKLTTKLGNDKKTTYYYQVMYPAPESPETEMTWQENNLMLAELALRGTGSGNALDLVNEVRASHSIDPLTDVNLDVIYVERDKELFCTGSRLPDERRFNKWHLGTDTWQYFPLPSEERNANPNPLPPQ